VPLFTFGGLGLVIMVLVLFTSLAMNLIDALHTADVDVHECVLRLKAIA